MRLVHRRVVTQIFPQQRTKVNASRAFSRGIGADRVVRAWEECERGAERERYLFEGRRGMLLVWQYTSPMMHMPLTKIISAVLLLVQVVVGVVPWGGNVLLCVPVGACEQHAEAGACSGCCDDGHGGDHAAPERDARGSCDAGPSAWMLTAATDVRGMTLARGHRECGCCVHVPLPSDPSTGPTVVKRAGNGETGAGMAPVVISEVRWQPARTEIRGGMRALPECAMSAIELSRRSTRLII